MHYKQEEYINEMLSGQSLSSPIPDVYTLTKAEEKERTPETIATIPLDLANEQKAMDIDLELKEVRGSDPMTVNIKALYIYDVNQYIDLPEELKFIIKKVCPFLVAVADGDIRITLHCYNVSAAVKEFLKNFSELQHVEVGMIETYSCCEYIAVLEQPHCINIFVVNGHYFAIDFSVWEYQLEPPSYNLSIVTADSEESLMEITSRAYFGGKPNATWRRFTSS